MKPLLFVLAMVFSALTSLAEPATDEAKKVFASYVDLERKFDPAVADLYSDDAIIKNTRRYPDGRTRTLSLTAAQYKQLIRQTAAFAKERGDTSKYSDVVYREEDGKVRVNATRFSELKKYSSPVSLLIAKKGDRWLIVEEISESQP